MRGQDRRDLEPGDERIQFRLGAPEPAQPGDRVGDRIRQDPVACRSLAATERPHPAAGLGQVDQPEIERERTDDRLRGAKVEASELLVETLALDRIVVAAQGDRPLPDPLHEREQLGAGLFVDDLAEQRPEEAHLDRERVASTGRPDPERFGRHGRRGGRRSSCLHETHRKGPFRVPSATGPQPCRPQPFSRLVS